MVPSRPPPIAVFAVCSASLHAVAFVALVRLDEAHAEPSFDPASQTLPGDTLVVDVSAAAATAGEPLAATAVRPAPAAMPRRRDSAVAPRAPGFTASALAAEPSRPPATFGAVGVRFATDLATSFTRAFPQAASADPIWRSASFGPGGAAEVTLVLDEDGHLVSHEVTGSPSPALRRSIERSIALLGARSFTAHAAVTMLRVRAYVSRDAVHDGLHGDVFALSAGSFSGDTGTAFFALPAGPGPGRRVDVEVRLVP